jgi:YegS/Rv2252/BmrU family lipid kinase
MLDPSKTIPHLPFPSADSPRRIFFAHLALVSEPARGGESSLERVHLPYTSCMRLIVNPAAGGGRVGQRWPQLEARLTAAGLSADPVFTDAPGHATELAAAAVDGGAARVAVAGGDGTVCEAVEGIYRAGGGELAILPLGTGNDAARTLGIPSDLEAASRIAVAGEVRHVDLIAVDDRVVFNAIGVGMTGDINDRAVRLKAARIPGVRGLAIYLLATLSSLFRYRRRRVQITTGDGVEERSMLILAVHGGPTTGGGFALTPDAEPDDGLLDFCLVPEAGPLGRLLRLGAALRGRLAEVPGTVSRRSSWLELHFDVPLPAHLDGNPHTLHPPVARFEVVPRALAVVAPVGWSSERAPGIDDGVRRRTE